MRQTLFYIPHELAGVPVFGFGWVLAAWVLVSIACLTWLALRRDGREAGRLLPFLLAVAAAIAYVLPLVEVDSLVPDTGSLGLPIRGYGVMLLVAIACGVGMAVHRARQVGIEAEHILSLATWLFVAGIAGARLFFIIQYWSTVRRDSLLATLMAILRFTEGGLVVYGSLIGGAVAFGLFVIRKRISPLQLADVVAPSLVLGLAIGRIGCLLNGCCYGGVCEDGRLTITFPRFSEPQRRTLSPAYHDQLSDQLASDFVQGIRLGRETAAPLTITAVEPASAAAQAGVEIGLQVAEIQGQPVDELGAASYWLGTAEAQIDLATVDGRRLQWPAAALPDRSRPVHPTQLYSSINGVLIFALAWTFFPFRRRVGEVCGLVLTIYPVTRFLLEWVRVDEAGRFGTELTISQWISLAILTAMLAYWPLVWRQPKLAAYSPGVSLR